MINVPKGTKDVLPSDSYKWQFVEKTAREVAKLAMQDLKTTAKHKIKTSIKRGVRNVLEE